MYVDLYIMSLQCIFLYPVSELKMPPAIKKRGRPKGNELTVVGLPAKKRRKNCRAPCPFPKMHTSEKERGNGVIKIKRSITHA